MPTHILVNGLGLTYKSTTGISTATLPDVCKTPSPGGPVPIPYLNIAQQSSLKSGTTTVMAKGKMIAVKGSQYSRSNGDEAGTAGGVKSGANMKATDWITYSFDVKMDGKNACRHTDKKFHNNQNTVDLQGNIDPAKPEELASGLKKIAEKCNLKVNRDEGYCKSEKDTSASVKSCKATRTTKSGGSTEIAGAKVNDQGTVVPAGTECTRLGTLKHKCCEREINEEVANKPKELGGIETEVPYKRTAEGPPAVYEKMAGGAGKTAKDLACEAYDAFLETVLGGPKSQASAGGLAQARRAARDQDIFGQALRDNRGAGGDFIPDVVDYRKDPPKAYDFKFNCKEAGEMSEPQKQKYIDCFDEEPEIIHVDGTSCA